MQPECTSPDGQCLPRDGRNIFAVAKAVDQVNALMPSRFSQAGIGLLTQNFGGVGVDRDDPIAAGLHVLRHVKAGSIGLGRKPKAAQSSIVEPSATDVAAPTVVAKPKAKPRKKLKVAFDTVAASQVEASAEPSDL